MSEAHRNLPEENPFCTRRIRPGAMPYLFEPGQSAESLVDALRAAQWRGEIIGPHGSGKSSLLASLIPAIEQSGMATRLVELHDGQRRLPADLMRDLKSCSDTLVIVDGYEQLSGWSRSRLSRLCRVRGLGLLVTAHVSVGLPFLAQTVPTVDLARRIVDQLLGSRASSLDSPVIARFFARHEGNLREMLFDLYDEHAQGGSL